MGSRPRWKVHEKLPVWGCALSQYLRCSAKTCTFSLSMVKKSLSVKGLSESTKAAPENWLCGQFVHTDRFILSTLVLSGSWEKFLPKFTLTCSSVCGIRKWRWFFFFFLEWLGLYARTCTLSKLPHGRSISLIKTLDLLAHFKLKIYIWDTRRKWMRPLCIQIVDAFVKLFPLLLPFFHHEGMK